MMQLDGLLLVAQPPCSNTRSFAPMPIVTSLICFPNGERSKVVATVSCDCIGIAGGIGYSAALYPSQLKQAAPAVMKLLLVSPGTAVLITENFLLSVGMMSG